MLRKLSFNSQLSQGIQKLSPDEFRKKIDGANSLKDSNEEPKTIDPITGKLITASESKTKYGDGTKLIYVRIDGEVHQKEDGTQTKSMGKIEQITVAEYQRRYTDYAEPPKAAESMQELLGIDTLTMKQADDDKYKIQDQKDNVKDIEVNTANFKQYLNLYDKPLKFE